MSDTRRDTQGGCAMSTEREEMERELAEELGCWIVNGEMLSPGGDDLRKATTTESAAWDALVAARLKLAGQPWRCFHCEFVTTDRAEALAHFGDIDDAEEFKPLCKWWANMSPDERGEALQDAIQQVNQRDEEIMQLQSRAESASLKLAAADRLEKVVEHAEQLYSELAEREGSQADRDAAAALRSALLEYSRTKV